MEEASFLGVEGAVTGIFLKIRGDPWLARWAGKLVSGEWEELV